ncbi:multidrug ABC transporter permease [Candidatus Falkowbacteria bacterium CG_4_9_14_3_um_filter_36_9]|uniref:Transport permease protein n=1 Tax=Candidatus Falkowbacteria bacterium CG02_land_8_20_14_3_00_36_14 TaxID=1974560 RepID=A0A2M7DQF7_9BACT|nr:MAG: multidrug ABC transporter permease [Candidatus Falkowbacteria bacterium CG02_land_8_20_14_3_00_36_14]PJA11307.1 MAG: multidrug ABC transporter permease [Candidatus Falkowbacteria bacterium CG_4_10_14_0_2_um_filter_36_22]PJB20760.1 MAG: multidrug ABC transporter permease [Candidatus Falkowbacteria bacterium CG_4_9_14_3_um_filter_36_9]
MEKIKRTIYIIAILWLRQIKRYIRSRTRMLGSLGQPILFLVALGFGFGPIFEKAGGGDYIQFLAPGIIAMTIIFTAIFSGIEVIADKQFGFLKETLVAPVSRYSIMIGRTLGGATVAVVQGIIIFILAVIIGFHPLITLSFPLAFVYMILIALFFTGLGTAIGSVLDDMHAFPLIINFLIMPLFFLSGALFPLKNLSQAINIAAMINPLSYGVDGIRGVLVGQVHFGLLTDFTVLVAFSVFILFLGSYLFSKIKV